MFNDTFVRKMKRIINILIILLTIVFLLPSAGFYFIRHNCLVSGDSMIVWSKETDCCANQSEISLCCTTLQNSKGSEPANNIVSSDAHKQCCSNIEYYIKDASLYDLSAGVKIKPLSFLGFATPVLPWYGVDNHTTKYLLPRRILPDKAEHQKYMFLMNCSLIL
jgi:hypothetical protein